MNCRTASLIGVASCLLTAKVARAGDDRIFADGFDPCCTIGGTVTGLTGSGLVLHLAAGAIAEDKPIAANGLYRLAASVPPGTVYALSIDTQPSGQSCSLAITGGTMGSSAVDNANLDCGAPGNLEWDSGNWGEDWN